MMTNDELFYMVFKELFGLNMTIYRQDITERGGETFDIIKRWSYGITFANPNLPIAKDWNEYAEQWVWESSDALAVAFCQWYRDSQIVKAYVVKGGAS